MRSVPVWGRGRRPEYPYLGTEMSSRADGARPAGTREWRHGKGQGAGTADTGRRKRRRPGPLLPPARVGGSETGEPRGRPHGGRGTGETGGRGERGPGETGDRGGSGEREGASVRWWPVGGRGHRRTGAFSRSPVPAGAARDGAPVHPRGCPLRCRGLPQRVFIAGPRAGARRSMGGSRPETRGTLLPARGCPAQVPGAGSAIGLAAPRAGARQGVRAGRSPGPGGGGTGQRGHRPGSVPAGTPASPGRPPAPSRPGPRRSAGCRSHR